MNEEHQESRKHFAKKPLIGGNRVSKKAKCVLKRHFSILQSPQNQLLMFPRILHHCVPGQERIRFGIRDFTEKRIEKNYRISHKIKE
jgi:hypothetical protein